MELIIEYDYYPKECVEVFEDLLKYHGLRLNIREDDCDLWLSIEKEGKFIPEGVIE